MSEAAVAPTPTVAAPSPEPGTSLPANPTPTSPGDGAAPQKPTPARSFKEFKERRRDQREGRAPREAPAQVSEAPQATPASDGADVTVDATGRAHGPDGKFVQKPDGSAEVPAQASADGATDEGAAQASPETVRIALPEGHPLTERGLKELPFAVPKEFEAEAKALVNGAARAKQVEMAEQRARQLEERLIRLEAERKWQAENPGELTPKQQLMVDEISADPRFGPEDAEALRRRLLADSRGNMDEAVEAQVREAQEARKAQEINRVATDMLTLALRRYRGWSQEAQQLISARMGGSRYDGPADPGTLAAVLDGFAAQVQVKEARDPDYMPTVQEFQQYADRYYATTPAGQQELERIKQLRAAQESQAKADAEAEAQRKAEEAAEIAGRNPLGRAPRLPSSNTSPSAQANQGAPKSYTELKARKRAAARGR